MGFRASGLGAFFPLPPRQFLTASEFVAQEV